MRRDEVSRLEAAVRDANPLPHIDDLIDSDEAAEVTLLVEQRRRTMTATPAQTTPQPTGPPPRRRRSMAWAFAAGFVVILLAIGAATVFMRGGATPVADEPAPESAVTTPSEATTATAETARDGWQEVATPSEQPWVRYIDQIEPLPGGGYVAMGEGFEDEPIVMWSPDGVDWRDGDPQRLVGSVEFPLGLGSLPETRSVVAVGNQVVVLHDTSQSAVALSIGDPRTGAWERVALDTTGVEGDLRGVRLAANDEEVLVAAYAVPVYGAEAQAEPGTQVVVWLVDAAQGTATRDSFSVLATFPEGERPHTPLVEWVEEGWIMFAVEDANLDSDSYQWHDNTLWTSLDGRTWSEVALPEGMGGVHSVRAGSSGVAAALCIWAGGQPSEFNNEGFWYSSDGLDWSLVPGDDHGDPLVASWGDRGFVIAMDVDPDFGGGVQLVAPDGSETVLMPSPFDGAQAAAASGDTLIALSWDHELWLYHEPAND